MEADPSSPPPPPPTAESPPREPRGEEEEEEAGGERGAVEEEEAADPPTPNRSAGGADLENPAPPRSPASAAPPLPPPPHEGEEEKEEDAVAGEEEDAIAGEEEEAIAGEEEEAIAGEEEAAIAGEEEEAAIAGEEEDAIAGEEKDAIVGEEEDAVTGEEEDVVEGEEEDVVAREETLRIFSEKFGEIEDDCVVPSPRLREINTPDRPAALRLLGSKYNNLMEKYKQQVAKCADECAPKYDGLKKKYSEECAERRRLYNELIELRGNIRVFCRCRPLSGNEVSRGCSSVIEIDPTQETELHYIPSDKDKKVFKFDHVFGPADNQETVFAESLPVVRSVLDGFNVCIFAYGQTGTGKTFTMEGVPENRGVNYRSLEELFRISDERSSSIAYTFSVSILEVYNEKIRDLLDESNEQTGKRLDIKQTADGTQEVVGLIESPIHTVDYVWEKLKAGAKNRSVGATGANELSSRSHSLVRVTVRSEHLVTGQRSRSHMWLVDLAGSERVAKTEVEGERLKESQFINRSLSALGDVISALASKNTHIPYRNSKLTHLLQSSLGGDCKTLMFVQISPSSADSGETLCSLNFASRVRGIEHGPARKQVDPAETFKLKQMVEKLRQEEKENVKLNESLQVLHLKYANRENIFRTLQDKIREAEQTCRSYEQRVKYLESELANKKKAARDTSRFTKPPVVPMRQRPPLGGISNRMPALVPSRSRFSKEPTIQNKENIPVMNKASSSSGAELSKSAGKARRVSLAPSRQRFSKATTIQNKEYNPVMNKASSSFGDELSKSVGKARRVSFTPLMRKIPLQPKRRSSIALLPSEKEQLYVLPEERASYLQMPRRRSDATFNSIPGTPLAAAAHAQLYATPEASGKFRDSMFGISKFSRTPPKMAMWNSPQQKLPLVSGSEKASRLCYSIQKRLVLSPAQRKSGVFSGAGVFNQAVRERMAMGGKSGKAQRVFNANRRNSVF